MRLEGSVPGNPHPETLLPPLSPLSHQLHTTSESSWTTLSRTTEVIAMERSPVKDRNYRTADASTPPYQGSAKREARVRPAPLFEARIRWISRAGAYAITACPRRPLQRHGPACEVGFSACFTPEHQDGGAPRRSRLHHGVCIRICTFSF